MTRNLWIGRPGALHEIDRAAKTFDRTADLGVTEFRSLGGRVTVQSTPRANRRTKLSWDTLESAHTQVLDRLARRVDGSGPVAVLDPTVVNLLDPAQARGVPVAGEDWRDHWSPLDEGAAFSFSTGPLGVALKTADPALRMGWRHGHWPGFPVVPGTRISFRLPRYWPATATAGLAFLGFDGEVEEVVTASGPAVSAPAPSPEGLPYVTPFGVPGTTDGALMFESCLTYDDEAVAGLPGDGFPAMAVTGYTDTPTHPLPYRNVSIELVEVSRAAR